MSILLVELVPQGIIFGADRNISTEHIEIKHVDDGEEGKLFIEQHHHHYSYSPRPKVLRWPQRQALIGYAGAAAINDSPTDEWLYEFIGNHLNFTNFETLAEALRQIVEDQRRSDDGENQPEPLVIHLGGFEERDSIQVPIIWVIRNAHSDSGVEDWRSEFLKKEVFWSVFEHTMAATDIREYLATRASAYEPFWFHQGIDLGTFNTLEAFLKAALKELYLKKAIEEQAPHTLRDWERQVRMSILTYGAYFQAYKEPYEQDVGSGADTVSIPWPEIGP